ncbi:TPA: hypothetical protein JD203_20015 [Cronobacter sakazakii]|uniref:putative T6SS immunity periplasmic lipoprotein n=2 Tax=Cronobacter sakazakii TaxID=28141 RepID=UPI0004A8967A|nr:putative T6SS immunity periplasmic lipoprotein [Cronobacter sakazakii]EGT5204933.1 hypothetical protein [Cronobacter sakazakii]EGT5752087.1 hypothetical protein [Cronobacter sakazakii]EIZ2180234.1 hypothetical protein [Cronobacter sakazakii]EIZ2224375.1 hypothetical protein [Cronobacter sakazakii]EIZ2227680.1 hypothetical protein [Cronobacter sakazakii]
MSISNKFIIPAIFLLGGCVFGENLESRYTKEIPAPAYVLNNNVCLSIPVKSEETIVSAMIYNDKKPSEQFIFPSDKQSESGHFCITTGEFKFETGQEYITYIEVNLKTGGKNKKNTRKSYVSTFQVIQKGNSFNIIQTAHQ